MTLLQESGGRGEYNQRATAAIIICGLFADGTSLVRTQRAALPGRASHTDMTRHVMSCHWTDETSVQIALDDAGNGPCRYCSPRHNIMYHSRHEVGQVRVDGVVSLRPG
jgi:hypothetical protein